MIRPRHLLTLAYLALLAGLAVSADEATAALDEDDAPAPVPLVQLEGCVLDPHGQPLAAEVRVRGSDGSLVGRTRSGHDGIYRVAVPADAELSVRADRGDRLLLLTGQHSLSLGACLRTLA